MSRTRAGRKAWETRVRFNREVGGFFQALAAKEVKFDAATTKAMIIERTAKASGAKEVITFSQAYGEISMWAEKSFTNISEDGLSDTLAAMFFQGTEIHTGKAVYRLWVKPAPAPAAVSYACEFCGAPQPEGVNHWDCELENDVRVFAAARAARENQPGYAAPKCKEGCDAPVYDLDCCADCYNRNEDLMDEPAAYIPDFAENHFSARA